MSRLTVSDNIKLYKNDTTIDFMSGNFWERDTLIDYIIFYNQSIHCDKSYINSNKTIHRYNDKYIITLRT